jgi:hypothetical protein
MVIQGTDALWNAPMALVVLLSAGANVAQGGTWMTASQLGNILVAPHVKPIRRVSTYNVSLERTRLTSSLVGPNTVVEGVEDSGKQSCQVRR